MNKTKPLKRAAPPLGAVVSMVAILAVCLQFLPASLDYIIAKEAIPDTFVRRMYPDYLSVWAIIGIRFTFGLLCASVQLNMLLFGSSKLRTVYIRPDSKLVDTTIEMKGHLYLYPFTCWSWIVLGLHFLLSSYVTWVIHSHARASPPTWLLILTVCLWKIAAPMTLLIGAVVKYALWPATRKKYGPDHNFKARNPLLQHNANILMALTELLFLGGMPLGSFQNITLAVIYGICYVFFSWSTMKHYNPETGPAAIYFFMDTTIGWKHTVSLLVLVCVLMLFYSVFYGVEQMASNSGFETHVGIFISLMLLACRFRD
mmetsp:Transcript_16242/g.23895  ORF Transcript_16242/g.23895 Transcript_16242/m.23895 type:complete len:315 (+) Transcript_16242:137-1081(+)